MHVVVAVSVQSSVHHGCQRDSFWLPSCMCTSTAHASLLPAAERATRPTANISTSPRRSAPACKRRAQSTSMSLSDRLEILGEQAQMYPQGTRKASKVGCKAHRAQLRTHQNRHCSSGTEEYCTLTWAVSETLRLYSHLARADSHHRSLRDIHAGCAAFVFLTLTYCVRYSHLLAARGIRNRNSERVEI